MTTKTLDAQWTADPTQPGRIAAGEAITIGVRVAFWRVPGGDAEAMRLVYETEALVLAAPAMGKVLRRIWNAHHGQDSAEAILAAAGVPLP